MSACTSAELVESPALFSESDAAERVLTGAVFDTLWVLGGPSDTLLAAPVLLRWMSATMGPWWSWIRATDGW